MRRVYSTNFVLQEEKEYDSTHRTSEYSLTGLVRAKAEVATACLSLKCAKFHFRGSNI